MTMGEAGIGDATTGRGLRRCRGWVAARLWWMLYVTGHPSALLDPPSLDASLESWTAAGGPSRRGPVTADLLPAFTTRPGPPTGSWTRTRFATALADGTAVVLDASAGERYRGEVSRSTRSPGTSRARSARPGKGTANRW